MVIPHQERQQCQRDDEEDDDEPQVSDAEPAVVVAAVLDVPLEEVTAREVVQIRLLVPGVETTAVPGLGRDQDQDPEEEGNQETANPFGRVLAARPPPQGEVRRRPGEEEQERHVPAVDERQHATCRRRQLRSLGVERLARVEEPGRVEGKQEQHRKHPEPVDVVQPSHSAPDL